MEVASAVAIATGTIIIILYLFVKIPHKDATASSDNLYLTCIRLLNRAPSTVVDTLKITELKIIGAEVITRRFASLP